MTEVQAARELPSPPMRRALRVDAGISLARLAAALGVSVQAISHWELGQRRPRPANAVAYGEALRALERARNGRNTTSRAAEPSSPPNSGSGSRRAPV